MRTKKQMLTKYCDWCGAKFKTIYEWQVYHLGKCRKAAYDQRRADAVRKAKEIIRQQAGL